MKFPEILRGAIEQSGLKKKDVAERAGLTRVALSKYLNGSVKPKIENLTKIANALGLPVSYFYESPDGELSKAHLELENWKKRALAAEGKLRTLSKVIPLISEANSMLSKIISE